MHSVYQSWSGLDREELPSAPISATLVRWSSVRCGTPKDHNLTRELPNPIGECVELQLKYRRAVGPGRPVGRVHAPSETPAPHSSSDLATYPTILVPADFLNQLGPKPTGHIRCPLLGAAQPP